MTTTDRARAYVAKLPPSISGAGGHAAAYHAACVLVHGFNLSTAEALPIMRELNCRCEPPWSESDLVHKLNDAAKAASTRPRGYLLGDTPRTPPPAKPAKPNRYGFGVGTDAQLMRLAKARPYGLPGLRWASARGVLVFGVWHGHEVYGITDASHRTLELRRMDGQPFPPHGEFLEERKSHAVKGSSKRWPIGAREAELFQSIALVEGVPDFLEAHDLALFEQASHHTKADPTCAPVAMLSGSPSIHEEALPMFKGKTVRIFAHAEAAGLKGAEKWRKQLLDAGAACVDLFDFSPYRTSAGEPVNDLYDWRTVAREHYEANPQLWRILP